MVVPYSDATDEAHLNSLANARLIAAAPDLLAFARAHEAWEALLIEKGRWEVSGDGLPTLTEEIYGAMMELQSLRNAAIAKAVGTSAPAGSGSTSAPQGNSGTITPPDSPQEGGR